MKARELLHALPARSRQLDLHSPPIAPAGTARQQSGHLASRDQGYDAVMFRLQTFGKFADRRPFPVGEAPYLKHQLVLQRGYPLFAHRLFAEAQESTQLIAEMRKPFKFGFGQVAGSRIRSRFLHLISISQYDIVAAPAH